MTTYRKPIAAFQAGNGDHVVVCDDGSVFMDWPGGWKEQAPIPGSERAKSIHWFDANGKPLHVASDEDELSACEAPSSPVLDRRES